MIIDLARFIEAEKPYWLELEKLLDALEIGGRSQLTLDRARRFHYLYERVSADLQRVMTFASEPELVRYLEALVSRAYGEIHETRRKQRFDFWAWFSVTIPTTFRRRWKAFAFAFGLTVLASVLGALAVSFDEEAKDILLPEMFANHRQSPSERVAEEESSKKKEGRELTATVMTRFSAQLIKNNISVAINAMAMGLTYGVGTVVMLFHNGVILGVVGWDYIQAGELVFLLGWLLPHGVIEIPAILIAGQAGFVLAGGLIGWGSRESLRERMRLIMPDVVTLGLWVALMLVWAGIVEAFFSQFHEPRVPYAVKIAFGLFEASLLGAFLMFGGSRSALGNRSRMGGRKS